MMKKTKTTVVFTHVGPSEEFRYALHCAICSRGHASMDELHAVTEQIETPKLTMQDVFRAGRAHAMFADERTDAALMELLPTRDPELEIDENTAFESFFEMLESKVDLRHTGEAGKTPVAEFDFPEALSDWLVSQGCDLRFEGEKA